MCQTEKTCQGNPMDRAAFNKGWNAWLENRNSVNPYKNLDIPWIEENKLAISEWDRGFKESKKYHFFDKK